VIQTRLGKYAIVGALALLSLVFATARAKKPRIVHSLAACFALAALAIAVRVKVAKALPPTAPVGDPAAFIAAVPAHVAALQAWCTGHHVPPPPTALAAWDEWLWTHREALGEEWDVTAPWLVAAYGELLRIANPRLKWVVRGVEPTVASRAGSWWSKSLFYDVHEGVFADA
jgi:hypothetical protein